MLSDTYYYEYGKKVQLTQLKGLRAVSDKNITYYQNSAGQKVGVKNEIIVKCKQTTQCNEIFAKYNLSEIKNLTSKILLIKLKAGVDPFETSQKLSLEEKIEFAHPNFVKKRKRR
jgi:hypothetical protein